MKNSLFLSRRNFLKLSGSAAFGAAVASYGRHLTLAAERAAALQGGSAIVTAIGTEPVGLDTCNPWNLGSALFGILDLVYDTWGTYDRQLNFVPALAESWERPDAETVVFNIRQGVKYHGSDRELIGEDVAWAYERLINEEMACSALTVYQAHVESITATDTYQFTVNLKTPNLLLTRIPLPLPVNPDAYGAPSDLLMQAEAGTGPWILDEWETENFISFRRNDDYWGNVPQIEEFRFQVMPEERATVAAMRAGQLNFLTIARIDNFLQLQGEAGITAVAGPSLEFRRLNVNHFSERLQNPDVLQALRFGINRQQFVDTLTQGLGQVSGPLSPAVTSFALPQDELEELQAYDPERARSLLSNAGYDDSDNRLRLDCLSIAGFKDFNDVAQIVQANLREIGVDVEIRIQEVGVWVDSRVTLHDYDLSVNDHGSGGFDPDFGYYRSDQVEQEWTGGGDPELDDLIDASNVTEEMEARRELVQNIQRNLIENVRELYLYSPPVMEAYSGAFVGYEPWPGGTNLRVFDREQVTLG